MKNNGLAGMSMLIGRKLKRTHETEGSRHDPYGVDVYTVTVIWRVAEAVDVRHVVSLRRGSLSGDKFKIMDSSKSVGQSWAEAVRHTEVELKSDGCEDASLRERFEEELGFGLHRFEEMKYRAGVANMAAHAGVSKKEAAWLLEDIECADRRMGDCNP